MRRRSTATPHKQIPQADAEIGKWLRNRDFRHALSLGIDRDQLNETFWLGLATPSLLRDTWTAAAKLLFPTP